MGGSLGALRLERGPILQDPVRDVPARRSQGCQFSPLVLPPYVEHVQAACGSGCLHPAHVHRRHLRVGQGSRRRSLVSHPFTSWGTVRGHPPRFNSQLFTPCFTLHRLGTHIYPTGDLRSICQRPVGVVAQWRHSVRRHSVRRHSVRRGDKTRSLNKWQDSHSSQISHAGCPGTFLYGADLPLWPFARIGAQGNGTLLRPLPCMGYNTMTQPGSWTGLELPTFLPPLGLTTHVRIL